MERKLYPLLRTFFNSQRKVTRKRVSRINEETNQRNNQCLEKSVAVLVKKIKASTPNREQLQPNNSARISVEIFDPRQL